MLVWRRRALTAPTSEQRKQVVVCWVVLTHFHLLLIRLRTSVMNWAVSEPMAASVFRMLMSPTAVMMVLVMPS